MSPAGKVCCRKGEMSLHKGPWHHAGFAKKNWEAWQTPGWPRVSNVSLWQRKSTAQGNALEKGLPGGKGRLSCPSTQHWWDHRWNALSDSGLSITKEMGMYWIRTREDDQVVKASVMRGEAQRYGTSYPGEEKMQRDLIHVHNPLDGWVKRRWSWTFSCEQAREKEHNLKQQKLHLNIRKYIFFWIGR